MCVVFVCVFIGIDVVVRVRVGGGGCRYCVFGCRLCVEVEVGGGG